MASRADQAKITKIIAASTMNIHMIGAANNHMSCFGTCCFRIDRIAPIRRESIGAALTIEETPIHHISNDQKMGPFHPQNWSLWPAPRDMERADD